MRFTLKHKAQLYQQFHVGLRSGLPLERLFEREALPRVFAAQSPRLLGNIRSGKSLAVTLRLARITQRWEEQLLAIGESGGTLERVLGDLALFFETRQRHLSALKAKLVYPMLVILVGILTAPLPELARDELTAGGYVAGSALQVLGFYFLYKLLIVRPFENAQSAAFSPLLIRSLRYVDTQHWVRVMFEAAYLNLMTLCLESGLDAAQTLKLLRDGCGDPQYRQRHEQALRLVETAGLSLAQTLATSGIIGNAQNLSFLSSSERSGTLHIDLRQYAVARQEQSALELRHFMKKLGLWFYLVTIGFVIATYL